MLEGLLIFFVIGGVILLIVVVVLLGNYFEKKRTAAMAVAAGQFGFDFEPNPESSVWEQDAHLNLFTAGHSRKATNCMSGTFAGVEVMLFDYRYTTGSGKNQTTSKQTIVRLASDALDLPDFVVRPEHFFHKIGSAFGYQDIDFDTHPEFSDKYLLRGSDEELIRHTFTPPVLTYFERHPSASAEAFGRSFIFYRSGRPAKPESLRELLTEGVELYKTLVG